MRNLNKRSTLAFIALVFVLFSLSSCLTAKNLDKYIADQYNNELPKEGKKKKAGIEVTLTANNDSYISKTVHKTDKFLPLLFYWKYDHRQICALNPAIPVTNFSNAVHSLSNKKLIDKLSGQKLELTVEQAPAGFSIVAKENVIWIVYAVTWAKVYIEPDFKDLVVSYKLLENEKALRTGTITVKNTEKNKGIRLFQSWKSATSEHLSGYTANLTNMTKQFVNQLAEEL